jgi:hypothetical protein
MFSLAQNGVFNKKLSVLSVFVARIFVVKCGNNVTLNSLLQVFIGATLLAQDSLKYDYAILNIPDHPALNN